MPDLLAPIMSRFANLTMTGDGLPEIRSLSYLGFESDYIDPLPDSGWPWCWSSRACWRPVATRRCSPALMRALRRFKGDLRAEGLRTRFVAADLYGGPCTRTAASSSPLRQFFREVKAVFPRFEGAVLVGNFPEATIVRSVAWAPGFINPPSSRSGRR